MSKFKLILFLTGLLPAISWAQGPCEFDVQLPSYYICYSENGFYLQFPSQPPGAFSGQFVQADGFYDAAAAGSGPHYVIYTADPAVCLGSDTVDFYVMDEGFIEIEGGPTSICVGDSTTLNAPNALEYDWLNNGDRINSYTFSPDSTTTYLVSGLDNTGCPNSIELTITVFSYGPELTISGPSYVCYGDTATFEVVGITNLQWNDGTINPIIEFSSLQDSTLSVRVSENPACDTTLVLSVDVGEEIRYEFQTRTSLCYGELFQISITGGNAAYYKFAGQNFTDFAEFFLEDDATLILEAYNDSGCFVEIPIPYEVNDNPVLDISAPEQVCSENPLEIIVTGAPQIEWVDLNTGEPVALTGENAYSIIASDSIRFQVMGINEFNCITTNFIEVPVYPTPDVRIDSLTPFCIDRSASVVVSGADYYVWNGLNTTPILTFPAVSDTVFTVLGSTVYGCFTYDTLAITVHPNPEIWLTGEYSICELDTATLIGAGADQYFWEGVLGTDTIDVTPSADSLFTLIGKNIFGCADTATYFVNVDPAPIISFVGDPEICVGDSVSLQLITDGLAFQWLGGSTQLIIPVDPADDTTYTVTAIGANSCPRTSSFVVVVNDYPVLSIDGNTIACFGDTLTLTGAGADAFFWNNGLIGDTIRYVPVASGVLRVEGNSNDCITEEVLNITVNESPSVQFAFAADTLCTSGAGASWVASPSGGELSGDGVVNNWFELSSAVNGVNTVSYTFTNAFNCSSTATDQIIVETCLGLEEEVALLSLYPNPCSEMLTLTVSGQSAECVVYSAMGQVVWSGKVAGTTTLETASWAPGTYVLNIGNVSTPQRIIKL
jgi:hypothetical protein